ncbi:MAG: ribonuclease J [Paracoccaceae bacterium]|nr:ribonuclease J [Paracoccaceae bacterium]
MSSDRLIYLPLGGAGEVGMNAYVYGYGPPGEERLILVDLGVTFPDMDGAPGVDLIFPDIAWLEERRDRLEAIVITHAHEDHVGALGHLWSRLRAPVLCRPFTAIHARRKLDEAGQDERVVEICQPWPEMRRLGPFDIAFLPVSHSIPETSAIVIDTPSGRVVHSADFKIDLTPVVGEPFDRALWEEVAKPGVRALICDSTNVFSPEPGRSEASIAPEITKFVAAQEGMVIATTFASNVARVKSLAMAGEAAGRSVCLLGRAMRRMIEAAVEAGVLTDFPKVVSAEEAADIPRENLMLLVTGSQGERRAASAQLSRGKYLGLTAEEGDTFLFSSKTIPGNERGVLNVVNAYSELGVDVQDDAGGRYHVSGHANRPDLEEIHAIVNPAMVIPMHGEHRMLREHMKLAEENDRPSIVAVNGTMVDLSGNRPTVTDHIEAGRIYLDGTVQIGAMDGVIRDRLRMARDGHVTVTLIIDEDGTALGEPWCDTIGLPETGSSRAPLVEVIEEDLSQFVGRAKRKTLGDDETLEEELRRIVRKTSDTEIGKKPQVTVVISRLS